MSKRKTGPHPKTRLTIGMLADRPEDDYHASVLRGVVELTEALDVNLLCFSGRSLRSPYGFEAQCNVLYDLVSAENVDGLVFMASSLGNFLTHEETVRFCERYRPLPIVSIAHELEGVSNVLVDNERGLRDVIAHLIEVHGCRRIAFIRGLEGNPEAGVRYRVYREVLAEHGLPFDPDLVAPGDFREPTGAAAISLFLDQRKVDLDAVVAANDGMALGALAALQARGLQVPDDVAVVGFDDIEQAKFAPPPLTTVRQPLYEQGWRAAEMLVSLLEGKEVPTRVTLPTEMVVRRSCGCPSEAVLQATAPVTAATSKAFEAAFAAQRAHILSDIVRAVAPRAPGASQGGIECCLDAFAAEVRGESAHVFLPALEAVLRQAEANGEDVSLWHGGLSVLRRHVLSFLSDGEVLARAENLWQQARVLIGESVQRAQAHQRLQMERRVNVLSEISEALLMTLDVTELMDVAAQQLPRMIKRCYLSLYENPQAPTEWARLMLAYDEKGRVDLEAGGQRFPSRQLVPEGLRSSQQRYAMRVEALHFRENQLGFALFELGARQEVGYETLRGQLSSALQRALLLEERQRGEETLARERNLLRTLIDNLPEYVFAKDAEGRFVVANMALARHMGAATPDDLIGKTDFDFYPQELAAQFYADEQALFRSGQSMLDHEEATRDPAGNPRWTLTTKVLLRDSRGKVTGLVGVSRDITERKQAEAERERLLADLARRALQLQTAAEVSRAASSILEPDKLIQQAVDLIRERFDLYYAGLFLVDQTGEWSGEPGKWAVLRAGTGEAGRAMLTEGHKLEIGGASMIGWCIANKRARIALDVGAEAVRFENPHLPETRSELALPLVSRGEAIGALTIQSTQEAAFSEEDVAILQTMADQLANAIANARLYAALAREQYLMNALMDSVPDHIYFKDAESRFLRISTALARWFGLSDARQAVGKTDFDFFTPDHARPAFEDEQRIIATGEPLLNIEERETWPDRPDTWVSTSKMPLRDEEGNIVGTFGISRDITDRKRVEIALARRALQLQTAAEVSRAASSILEPDKLIQQAVDLIRERFDLYYAGLFLVDQTGEWSGEPGKWAVLRAGTGEAGRAMLTEGHKLEIGGASMIGWCIANKRARIALDVGAEAVRFENPHLPETRSELALPLVSRGEVIGALTIQSTQEAAFSEEDVVVFQAMADQLANAIANARLYEQMQARATELAVLNEVGQALTTRLSIEEVLGEIYRGVSRLMDATNFYLALYDPDKDEISFPLDVTQEERDKFHTLSADEGLTGYIIRNRTSVLIKENLSERLAEMGVKMIGQPAASWLGVPMIVGDRVLGAIGVQNYTTPSAYDEHDRDLLTVLANQAAIAIQNASLFNEQQQISRLLSGRVRELGCLNDIGRKIDESPPIPDLLQWVAERIPLAMQYADECIAAVEFEGQVYGSPEAIYLPCQIVGGLRVGGERVGQIYVAYREKRDFLDEESALLGDIVRRVSAYIENRRLLAQIQAALQEVEATHQRYLRQAWSEYLQATGPMGYEARRPDAPPLGDAVLPEVRRAMEQRGAVVVTDGGDGGAGHSAVVTPVAIRGTVIGALGVHAEDGARQWSEDEVALVEAIAERVAQVAENLRLLDETQRRAARERLIGEITSRMRETLDMETILKTAVDEIYEALGVDKVAIRLTTD